MVTGGSTNGMAAVANSNRCVVPSSKSRKRSYVGATGRSTRKRRNAVVGPLRATVTQSSGASGEWSRSGRTTSLMSSASASGSITSMSLRPCRRSSATIHSREGSCRKHHARGAKCDAQMLQELAGGRRREPDPVQRFDATPYRSQLIRVALAPQRSVEATHGRSDHQVEAEARTVEHVQAARLVLAAGTAAGQDEGAEGTTHGVGMTTMSRMRCGLPARSRISTSRRRRR